MKYLRLFDTHADYEDFTKTQEFILPNVSRCRASNDVHYNEEDYSKRYLTFKVSENGTFSFTSNNIQYSLDNGQTWVTLTAGSKTPIVSAGNKIMWKANGITPTSSVGIGTFSSTGKFDVEGNVMSLVNGDNFMDTTTITNFLFLKLFMGCTKLVTAENLCLPSKILAACCYQNMFCACSLLNIAPKLPATTLGNFCYSAMFRGCTSLNKTPILAAKDLPTLCYCLMFYGCSSLENISEFSAVTVSDSSCERMFYGCTSLLKVSNTLLSSIKSLGSTCFAQMFYNCISLTTAPELPATTLVVNCYLEMFYGCSNLNYIKAMFTTTPSTSYTKSWVYKVSSTGTFIKNSQATWDVTGSSGVPSGWTVVTADS